MTVNDKIAAGVSKREMSQWAGKIEPKACVASKWNITGHGAERQELLWVEQLFTRGLVSVMGKWKDKAYHLWKLSPKTTVKLQAGSGPLWNGVYIIPVYKMYIQWVPLQWRQRRGWTVSRSARPAGGRFLGKPGSASLSNVLYSTWSLRWAKS